MKMINAKAELISEKKPYSKVESVLERGDFGNRVHFIDRSVVFFQKFELLMRKFVFKRFSVFCHEAKHVPIFSITLNKLFDRTDIAMP